MRLSRGVSTQLLWVGVGLSSLFLMTGCDAPGGGAGPAQRAQVSALADEGLHWFHDDEYDRAFEIFDRVIALDPQYGLEAFVYGCRSICNNMKGNYDQALADINRQLEGKLTQEYHATGLVVRGNAYMSLGNHDLAIADYTEAMRLDPRPGFYVSRGQAYVKAGQWEEGIADLTKALNPADVATIAKSHGLDWQGDALWHRGRAYYKLGQREAARADARAAQDFLPQQALAFEGDHILDFYELEKRARVADESVAIGTKAEDEGNLLAAFQAYQRAHAWGVGRSDAMTQAAAGMMRLYPKLSARPTVSEQVRRLAVQGDTAAGAQKYDQALALYARTVEAAPWWPKARYNLAMLKAQRDNFPGAIAEMQQYLTLAPGAPDIRVAQDLIYQWQYKQQSAGKP